MLPYLPHHPFDRTRLDSVSWEHLLSSHESAMCGDARIPFERTDEHYVERHASFLKRIREAPIDLLFLGDSITRRWADHPDAWNRYFGKYNAANFGIGSDTTQSLLWRLQHGELDGIRPKAVVVLIGTNNVPTHDGKEIASAIGKIVAFIRHKVPGTRILLMALFPRGQDAQSSDGRDPQRSCPERSYRDTIREVNDELSRMDDGSSIHFIDIGRHFLDADGEINTRYMEDKLHIIEPGYVVWAEALKHHLDSIMAMET